MSKLTELARGEHCHLRHPGCDPGPENEAVVFCHAPSVDKALARKSPDWWGCPGCANCHAIQDGRKSGGIMPKEIRDAWLRGIYEPKEIRGAWLRGIYEWQAELVRRGVLQVVSR